MDFALTIDGLPYYATTGTLPVYLWNAINDPDEPKGATALTALEMPRGNWTERMRLVEGDLEVGGLTFELHDVTPDSGIAAGQPWLTWLASRQPIEIDSAVLSAAMTDVATTFVLTSTSAGAISGSIPCVLWVDDEAINCASYNGGTRTVTVAAGGRGYYGTRARAHAYDAETSVVPEAWVAPPWINRRRVLLWRIDDAAGTAHVIWRGYANRPRLSPNGASWQLQCEPAWTVDRARPLAAPSTSMRVRGYSPVAVQFGARVDGAQAVTTTGTTFSSSAAYDAIVFTTIDQLIAWSAPQLARILAAGTGATSITAAQVDIQRLAGSRRVRMRVNTSGAVNDTMMAVVRVFSEDTDGSVAKKNPQFSEVEAELPSAAIVLPNVYTSTTLPRIPLTSVGGLATPTTATATSYTDGPHTATVHTALHGDAGDDRRLVLLPESAAVDDATIGGPAIRARYRYVDTVTGRTLAAKFGRKRTPIDSAIVLTLGSVVNTTHWALGLKAVIDDDTHIRSGADPRNFDTTTLAGVARITESDLSARRWLLSGELTLGDIAVGALAAEGCCPAVRGDGKVGFAAVRNPTPTETVTATFTNAQFVVGTRALWEDGPAGIVGTANVEIGKNKVTVNDQRTIGRYGQGRVASFELIGLDYSGDVTDARLVASRALTRVVQVFGEPAPVVKWTTPLGASGGGTGFLDAAYCGDIVAVTEATTPAGDGTRGNTLRRCQVIARTIDLARGTIMWEALALPVAYAYAPAIRVTSISGAVVTADYQYVLEGGGDATDYAGTTTGAAGNRGVTKFVAGDKVKLLLRDSTTYTDEPMTVLSVNGAAGTITLTASVPTSPTDWPTVCGTGTVDLVYDGYETASIQAAQKLYAVVGNLSASYGGIGTSGDKSRRWGA